MTEENVSKIQCQRVSSEPAFPILGEAPGLTKRELFAAMAMQGICSNTAVPFENRAEAMKTAVLIADALVAELCREDLV